MTHWKLSKCFCQIKLCTKSSFEICHLQCSYTCLAAKIFRNKFLGKCIFCRCIHKCVQYSIILLELIDHLAKIFIFIYIKINSIFYEMIFQVKTLPHEAEHSVKPKSASLINYTSVCIFHDFHSRAQNAQINCRHSKNILFS